MKKLDVSKLLLDIENLGYKISSIDDLWRLTTSHTKNLIPLLIRNITSIEDEDEKKFLVRALGVKGYFEVTETLIEEFKNCNSSSYKWVIGDSLSIILDKRYEREYVDAYKIRIMAIPDKW